MIARVDGQVVLVAGAIPGERVHGADRARRQGRRLRARRCRSTSRRPIAASRSPIRCAAAASTPHRVSAAARDQGAGDRRRVRAHRPARRCRRRSPSPASPEDGYRMRARLHVRGHRLGFFREGHARALRRARDAPAAAGDLRRARSADGGAAVARPRRGARDRAVGERRRVASASCTSTPSRRWTPRRSSALAGTDGLDRPRRRPFGASRRSRHVTDRADDRRRRAGHAAAARAGVLPGQPVSAAAISSRTSSSRCPIGGDGARSLRRRRAVRRRAPRSLAARG